MQTDSIIIGSGHGRAYGNRIAAACGAPPRPPRQPAPPIPFDAAEFHRIVDALVDLNKRNREQPRAQSRGETLGRYCEYFATVRAYVGRGGGASSYIRERATEHDLVIVGSDKVRDSCYQRYGMPCRVATPDELSERRMRGHQRRYNKIYIDDPSFVFQQINAHELYYTLGHDDTQTFILLGI